MIGWWGAVANAKEVEKEAENGEGEFAPEATYVEQTTVAAPAQTTSYQQTAQQIRPASPVSDDQKRILMGMTDDELNKVISNPTLYANPAFVEEAKKMLTKRQAWEMIKDYTDDQLLSVVHDNIQGFTPEVLDAASMELLARENDSFVNEVNSLSNQELQGIIANADSYYDGYIQLATRILNHRLNASGSPQQ